MPPTFDIFERESCPHDWVPIVERLRASRPDDALLGELATRYPIVGSYRLLAWIGTGAMARVFAGWDEMHHRVVAVKLFEPRREQDWSLIERFQNEAEALHRIRDPHVVSLLDRGTHKGRVFIVMNLIEGHSVADLIRYWRFRHLGGADAETAAVAARTALFSERLKTMKPHSADHRRLVLRIGRDVSGALATAHQQRVIHRDIKPSNLLLDRSSGVWVTDFGLAVLSPGGGLTRGGERLTRHGDLVGTVAYMSPHAIEGENTPECDVYALAVTLFELATLRRMWGSRHDHEILKLRFEGADSPVLCGQPELDPELREVLAFMLTGEATAAAAHAALTELKTGGRVTLPRVPVHWRWTAGRWFRQHFRPGEIYKILWLWAAVVLTLVVATAAVHQYQQSRFRLAAEQLVQRAEQRLQESINSAELLQKFLQHAPATNRPELASFARPLLKNRSELKGIGIAETVADPDPAAGQIQPENPGMDTSTIWIANHEGERQPAPAAEQYVVLTELQPESLQARMVGMDLSGDRVQREALKRASFIDAPAIAVPSCFLDEHGRQEAVAIYGNVDRDHPGKTYAVVFIQLAELFRHLGNTDRSPSIYLEIGSDNQPQGAAPIYAGDQRGRQFRLRQDSPRVTRTLNIGRQTWSVELSPIDPWQKSPFRLILVALGVAVAAPLPLAMLVHWIGSRR